MFTNPYEAYEAGSVLSSQSPMQLIVALYEGAIGGVQEAQRCLEAHNIMARAKAITKATNIIAELHFSLKQGGTEAEELTANLSRLYLYMQQRLLEANMKQIPQPLIEVEGLLRTLLGSWYVVAEKENGAAVGAQPVPYSQPPAAEADPNDGLRINSNGYY